MWPKNKIKEGKLPWVINLNHDKKLANANKPGKEKIKINERNELS